jgi:hypothetical protein
MSTQIRGARRRGQKRPTRSLEQEQEAALKSQIQTIMNNESVVLVPSLAILRSIRAGEAGYGFNEKFTEDLKAITGDFKISRDAAPASVLTRTPGERDIDRDRKRSEVLGASALLTYFTLWARQLWGAGGAQGAKLESSWEVLEGNRPLPGIYIFVFFCDNNEYTYI